MYLEVFDKLQNGRINEIKQEDFNKCLKISDFIKEAKYKNISLDTSAFSKVKYQIDDPIFKKVMGLAEAEELLNKVESISDEIKSEDELKDFENILKEIYREYYVSKDWFENKIQKMVKDAGGKVDGIFTNGAITKEQAEKQGKGAQYKVLTDTLVAWFFGTEQIKFPNNVEIIKVNLDIKHGYAIDIQLRATSNSVPIEVKGKNKQHIKIDFHNDSKSKNLTDEQAKELNKKQSKYKKHKNKIIQLVLDDYNAIRKALILFIAKDKDNQEKLDDFKNKLVQITSAYINYYSLSVTEKVVNKIDNPFIKKAVETFVVKPMLKVVSTTLSKKMVDLTIDAITKL